MFFCGAFRAPWRGTRPKAAAPSPVRPPGWRFGEAGGVERAKSYHDCHKSSRTEVGSPPRGLAMARLRSRGSSFVEFGQSEPPARNQGRRPPCHRQSAPSGWRFGAAGRVDWAWSYLGGHKSSRTEAGSPSRGPAMTRLFPYSLMGTRRIIARRSRKFVCVSARHTPRAAPDPAHGCALADDPRLASH